jgi:hypothetical protein
MGDISDINEFFGVPATFYILRVGTIYYVVNKDKQLVNEGIDFRVIGQWAIDNVPADGGKIRLAPNTTFDLGSPTGDGLVIPENKPKRIDFIGCGVTTQIIYTGIGIAIRIVNSVDTSSHIYWEVGYFMLSGVTSPFSSVSTTVTTGRHGIKIDHTYGTFDLHHVFVRNFDVCIWSDSTEFSGLHHFVCIEFNTGVMVTGGSGTNTLSGLHITDFKVSGGHDVNGAGIFYNATQYNAEGFYIGRGVINVMPHMIRIDGFATNPTIEDIYTESTLPAAEATYAGETLECIWLKGTSGNKIDQVFLKNLRMGGVENTDYAIVVEYADKVTLDTCVAKGFRKSMVEINSNSVDVRLHLKNSRLRGYLNAPFVMTPTPYLIDVPSDAFLTTADSKLVGTVEEGGRMGIIVNVSSTGLVEGDVVILTGADATYATTTTVDSPMPGVIMYPNAGANRPGVIIQSGRAKVNVNSATALGDTLTTSTTSKKAGINNSAVDQKIVLAYCLQAIGATGLAYCQIGR